MVVVQVKPLQPLPDKPSTLKWQHTHKRRWCGGQEDAGRRQTEWKLQMKEEQVKPWQQTDTQTDRLDKKEVLFSEGHWKLSECCGTWQEPSVQEHTLSLHQSAGLGGLEVSLQTEDPFT
ncbi:uncharacterized protein LOC135097002 isoform X6 [Scylla paramamosain]|uniref:uncharacterized protein LOC135097002 isoform X6 n=1 Tax=Scylla paramamosain TaxID=85552 RepID=UPI003082745A